MPAERVAPSAHLDKLSPRERTLWDRFAALVAAAGPAETVATKSRIAFRAHRIFAGGFFAGGHLEVFFDLPHPVPDPQRDDRFVAVWEQGPKLWTHRMRVDRPDQLDRRLAAWLAESWATYSRPARER